MARTANPYTQVIKRLAKLQAKADKLNAEIASFAKFVEAETNGGQAPASPVKKAATRKTATNAKKPIGKKTAQKPTIKAVPKSRTSAKPKVSQSKKPKKSDDKQMTRAKLEIPMRDGKPDYLATLNWDSDDMPVALKGKKKY